MSRGNPLFGVKIISVVSSSSSDSKKFKLLDIDHEETYEVHALTHDTGSLSAMSQSQGMSLHSKIQLITSVRSN